MTSDEILTQTTCSVPEAATVLGISRESAYRAARAGELPVIRLGRRQVVSVAQLRALLGLPVDRVDPARR
jgi:excisionase family DNA binding protein